MVRRASSFLVTLLLVVVACVEPAAPPATPTAVVPTPLASPTVPAPATPTLVPTSELTAPPRTPTPAEPTPTPEPPLPVISLPEGRRFTGYYAYDEPDTLAPFDVDHAFVSWEQADAIDAAISRARRRSRAPLLTIEPFTSAGGDPWRVVPETLALIDGVGPNDATIRASARAIRRHAPQVVLVRFAHEMELIDNYPWSQRDCGQYIAFFRRYHDLFVAEGVTNVRWIWSPAGNQEAPCYYPGDAYVDYVGLTVLGYEAWDRRWGESRGRTFAELYGEKERRVSRFRKPIIVAELGVATGDDRDAAASLAYKANWLAEAARTLDRSPRVVGVAYFNAINPPNAWTGDQPDWRIDPGLLYAILTPAARQPAPAGP